MLTISKQKAQAVIKQVAEAWKIPKSRWPDIVWLKNNASYCPGFFSPYVPRKQKSKIGICDNCGANQMVVLLHELSHWVSFEQTGVAPHDDDFWHRTENLYRIYRITPAEARATEKRGYPSEWKGLKSWE